MELPPAAMVNLRQSSKAQNIAHLVNIVNTKVSTVNTTTAFAGDKKGAAMINILVLLLLYN